MWISEGEILLECDLLLWGVRGGINGGEWVCGVGGWGEIKGMKKVGGRLGLELGWYGELEWFVQFFFYLFF